MAFCTLWPFALLVTAKYHRVFFCANEDCLDEINYLGWPCIMIGVWVSWTMHFFTVDIICISEGNGAYRRRYSEILLCFVLWLTLLHVC